MRIAILASLAVLAIWSPALATLHPGDQLAITVYNHPELQTNAIVDGSGKVSLPLAGTVDAKGLDTQQLSQRIVAALQPYVIKPAVDVRLVSQNPTIFVAGGPGGSVAYRPGDTLGSAIASLKLSDGIDIDHVKIIRDGKTLGPFDLQQLTASGTGGPALLPGDTIALASKPIAVKISGAVQHPGYAYLDPGEPLSDALAQVGGPTQNAANTQAILQRNGARTALALGGSDLAQPARNGDTLDVPEAVQVEVVGMVGHPGQVTLRNDFTLLSAIYEAGGPDKYGDIRKVAVMHDGQKKVYDITALTHGNTTQDPALEDGDVVFVPEGHKIDWRSVFSGLAITRFLFPSGHL